MTTIDLLNKINSSELSEATKQKIQTLVAGNDEVTPEMELEIKDIIQEEIDADFAALGVTNDIPEVIASNEQFATDVDAVEKELDADLAYVETELNELDSIRKGIAEAEDHAKAEDLKAQLTA